MCFWHDYHMADVFTRCALKMRVIDCLMFSTSFMGGLYASDHMWSSQTVYLRLNKRSSSSISKSTDIEYMENNRWLIYLANSVFRGLHFFQANVSLLRFTLLLTSGVFAIFGSRAADCTGCGALGCLVLGFVAGLGWRKQTWPSKRVSFSRRLCFLSWALNYAMIIHSFKAGRNHNILMT